MSVFTRHRRAFLAVVAAAGIGASFTLTDSGRAPSHGTTRHVAGALPDGATYLMDVPADWNGTVLLYSHGLVAVTGEAHQPNPAENAPDYGRTKQTLLDDGYALIGSSYAAPGWVPDTAVTDQIATLDRFHEEFGRAKRTIFWGVSLGGMITTKLAELYGDRIDGSLALCGTEGGGVARWNSQLDLTFALRTLLAPGAPVRLAGFPDRAAADHSAAALTKVTTRAQRTPRGRARIALAAALANVAGYNTPEQRRPGAGDWMTTETNQYDMITQLLIASSTQWRQDGESHAGGVMSWNRGVDYARMLQRSPYAAGVAAHYDAAGLSLDKDLRALAEAPRISSDPSAVGFMARTSSFSGKLSKPQLNVHTVYDGLVPVQNEDAYRDTARLAGASELLHQTYVDRAGHCNFTEGEVLSALKAIERRIATGRWGDTGPRAMNAAAPGAGDRDRAPDSRYVSYDPRPFLRPFDLTGHRG